MVLRTVSSVARGFGLTARSRETGVVGRVDPADPSPLVLVHGYLDTLDTPWWSSLTDHLTDAGWDEDRLYHVECGRIPGATTGSPRRYADDVQATVELAHDVHGEPVNLLAHSMGGLTARWCVEQGDGAELVDDLVTLGTPHQGTYAAYLGVFTAGCRSMVPSSPTIRTLNGDGLAPSVRYTAVASRTDSAIVPSASAFLPDDVADEDSRNVGVSSASHVEMVYDPAVVSSYVDRLA